MTAPTWPDLIGLMATGESRETPFSGILEVDDWYTGAGRAETLPNTVRVFKKGRRYRVETLSGEVLFIRGTDRAWRFARSADLPQLIRDPDDVVDHAFGSYAIAIGRPRADSWCDRGPEAIAGRVAETVYLGRASWDVAVHVSAASTATAHLTIDAATGLVLRWGSEEFGDDFRWTRLGDVPDAADSLFCWDGEAVEAVATIPEAMPTPIPWGEPLAQDARADPADLTPLSITVSADPEVFEATRDGAFHLGYDLGGFVTVLRRPHRAPDGPFIDDRDGWTSWTDDGWDWSLKLPTGMHPDQVAAIRDQLRVSHRDVG